MNEYQWTNNLRMRGVRSTICVTSVLAAFLAGCFLDPEGDNASPYMRFLTIDRGTVYPDSVSVVRASAGDRDGDRLNFRWEATAGGFPVGAVGDSVFWRAPDSAGVCTLSVIVSDGDASIRGSLEIVVHELPRPVIVVDRCPARNVLGEPVRFHGEFEEMEPNAFYYSWTLICEIEGPECHPWTQWVLGDTTAAYWDITPLALYTFQVKCAVEWGDGLLESANVAQCQFWIRDL